jgi:hypothetical protein
MSARPRPKLAPLAQVRRGRMPEPPAVNVLVSPDSQATPTPRGAYLDVSPDSQAGAAAAEEAEELRGRWQGALQAHAQQSHEEVPDESQESGWPGAALQASGSLSYSSSGSLPYAGSYWLPDGTEVQLAQDSSLVSGEPGALASCSGSYWLADGTEVTLARDSLAISPDEDDESVAELVEDVTALLSGRDSASSGADGSARGSARASARECARDGSSASDGEGNEGGADVYPAYPGGPGAAAPMLLREPFMFTMDQELRVSSDEDEQVEEQLASPVTAGSSRTAHEVADEADSDRGLGADDVDAALERQSADKGESDSERGSLAASEERDLAGGDSRTEPEEDELGQGEPGLLDGLSFSSLVLPSARNEQRNPDAPAPSSGARSSEPTVTPALTPAPPSAQCSSAPSRTDSEAFNKDLDVALALLELDGRDAGADADAVLDAWAAETSASPGPETETEREPQPERPETAKSRRAALIARSLAAREAVLARLERAELPQRKAPAPAPALASKGPARRRQPARYRGWCEACHAAGTWCGFDHDLRRLVRGPQHQRTARVADEAVSRARKALVAGLEPTARAPFFKAFARLEKRFAAPGGRISAATDPRAVLDWLALPVEKPERGLTLPELEQAFAHLGLVIDKSELAVLAAACAASAALHQPSPRQQPHLLSPQRRSTARRATDKTHLALGDFVRLCLAAGGYRPEVAVAVAHAKHERASVELEERRHDATLKAIRIARELHALARHGPAAHAQLD